MKCPECHFENRDGAKFCKECGNKLELTCPQCGNAYASGTKFCDECGQSLIKAKEIAPIDYDQPTSYTPKHLVDKILTTRSSIEGERKLVTVLFADVAHSTAIFENLDPEDVHQIMDGYFKILMDEIHRYEGTINQFRGDGVMALFGAPIAHEDHAQRACHASLAIQNALDKYAEKLKHDYGIAFKTRIGLNTGPVVVGSIGDDLRMDYTAQGNTSNLASRMESNAEPGTVLISENTYKLARDYFDFESKGKIQVKGKEAPVEVYQLLKAGEVETRIGASEARGLTKFVGRRREKETLKEAFDKAASGQGQVVGIVGEAGVGKSRLLFELRNVLPPGGYSYFEGHCLHYGSSMPYLPLLDIFRSYVGIKEGDPEPVIKKKMRERILGLDGNLRTVIPPFQELLSLKVEDEEYAGLESKQKREKTFEAIRDLLIRVSQERPLTLAVEDLHWIDQTSEEFLDYMIGWLANTHILLIVLYRPEYTHAWGSRSYYCQIGVGQLSAGTSAELVTAILQGGEVLPEIRELILSRTAGNPLFMEELTHSLLENGTIRKQEDRYVLKAKPTDIHVPDTIQGIIAARMDRLEEDLKRIMQVASVIGREFAFRILHAITEMKEDLKSNLLNLQGLEFIYEKSLFPELEYIFRHALTQEVAYKSLLVKRRKEIHEKIAQAIEKLYPARLEEFCEMLAHHYARSENASKAWHYLKWSGSKATKNHSLREAFRYYKETLKVLKSLPDTEENKRQLLEILHLITMPMALLGYPDDSFQILGEGEKLSRQVADQKAWITFHSKIGHYHFIHGNPVEGIKYGEECFRSSEQMQDVELMIATGNELCGSYTMTGRHLGVIDVAPKIIRMIERTQKQQDFFGRPFNPYVDVHGYYGMSMALTGNFEEAIKLCDKGLDFAVRIGHLPSLSYIEASYGYVVFLLGDGKSTIDHAQKALEYSEEGQVVLTTALAWSLLGIGHFLLGDTDSAKDYLEKSLDFQRETGMSFFLAQINRALGAAHFARGNPEKASVHAHEALNLSLKNRELENEALSRILLGQTIGKTEKSKFDEARDSVMEGIKILEKLKLRSQYAVGYLELGQLYAENGYTDKALENVKKAEGMFKEMGMDFWLAATQEILKRL